ncbi:MAG: phosphoribosylamine--glycine ligase [Flavobacteriales bacterium]|nr:phosphoribosylamine--glycine ligase [Flavobacteriales bacterium]
MNVLVLGSGGREHALSHKISQSNRCEKLYIAPGNAGTAALGENVNLNIEDAVEVGTFVKSNAIDIVVIGPEAPLVSGLHDGLKANPSLTNLIVVGPRKAAAELEGSKDFAKKFMIRHNIPTAAYETFTKDTLEQGQAFLETLNPPYVLKADGLAAGKGVLIIEDLNEAKAELKNMLVDAKFGDASTRVVIEEFLAGIEFSIFALADGRGGYALLPEAKDYKRIGEGDTGLNTGGMGAVSPVPFFDDTLRKRTIKEIIEPTIQGLVKDNLPYQGFVFFGLINTNRGPKVIEYNVRLGDPETEVVIPRLQTDIIDLFIAMNKGTIGEIEVEVNPQTAATVMAVSGGYPGSYEKGKAINGLRDFQHTTVYHAGTKLSNEVITSGGRVMAFTSFGVDKEDALSKSYAALNEVSFEGMNYRKDIGFDL